MIKGDALCASIMAASILAKVYRDGLMTEFDRVYPGYGFAEHKGYATPEHRAALRKLGPSPIHRMTWRPIRALQPLT
jgi:ribonuclease HII